MTAGESGSMKLVTAEQMRRIEATAAAGGVSLAGLMDQAGAAVAEVVLADYGPQPGPVLVLVGPGNNGGDGLVAARVLHEAGVDAVAYVWKHPADDRVYGAAQGAGVPITRHEDDRDGRALADAVARAHVIVDALLGFGVTRPIEGELARLLRGVKAGLRPAAVVVAVDLPSGLNADTGAADPLTLAADTTVTFGFPKVGLFHFPGAGLTGEVVVVDIGLDAALAQEVRVDLTDVNWVREKLPARPVDANKGTFGKALIVAGSINYVGAAYLAGAAATRVGAGLVTMAVPQMLYPILATRLIETTWLPLAHDMGAIREDAVKTVFEKAGDYSALLVGPGLGQEDTTKKFVQSLVQGKAHKPPTPKRIGFQLGPETAEESQEEAQKLPVLVVDADGLNALAEAGEWWTQLGAAQMILTPHPGELSRLVDKSIEDIQADRLAAAQGAAEKFKQIVVLKGAHTVVAAPDGRTSVSPFANPALATAGTGDVLAGAIVGLLAQGLDPFDAAAVGVYVHGLAGERVREELGEAGAVAGDLLPNLPLALLTVRQSE